MSTTTRRKITEEFKREAVRLTETSGQFRGQRHIGGGRSDARKALYMAALAAAARATKGELAQFYAGLRKRGKPAKVALVACMRKLIVRLNAMLAKGKTWEEATT